VHHTTLFNWINGIGLILFSAMLIYQLYLKWHTHNRAPKNNKEVALSFNSTIYQLTNTKYILSSGVLVLIFLSGFILPSHSSSNSNTHGSIPLWMIVLGIILFITIAFRSYNKFKK
jgi:hypothetical protein